MGESKKPVFEVRRTLRSLFLACGLLTGALILAVPRAAGATTIAVTTTDDDLAANGNCTLREAIVAANTHSTVDACPAGSGDDVISLPAGTYVLSLPESLEIAGKLRIAGAGVTTATIRRPFNQFGGALLIDKTGDVDIERVRIVSNVVRDGQDGAINNAGQLRLVDAEISDNGALFPTPGGAIFNSGTLTITRSAISNNSVRGGSGGGIFNAGTATILSSTISGNSAPCTRNQAGCSGGDGGGIANTGQLTIMDSTVSGNIASFGGGGIHNRGSLTILNSSIVQNKALGEAIFEQVINGDGGGLLNDGFAVLASTIVGANTSAGTGPDCSGALTSLGFNLIQNPSGCSISGSLTGNLLNVDPRIGPLQDNGGPTLTHALLPGSPAIDGGNPAPNGSNLLACTPTDQRGFPRPQDGKGDGQSVCDIGAFEVQP